MNRRTYFSYKGIYIVCMLVLIFLGVFIWNQGISKFLRIPSNTSKALCDDCNIILMTLDSCSAKNISCYGYGRNTTPNLCAYAEKNQLFLNSYANATWTLPSHVSLLTGLLPSAHRVNTQFSESLFTSHPFLPEILQQNGYKTVLFQDADSGIFPSTTVYNRGIDGIYENYTVNDIFDQLEKANGKLFLTYYNSHCHEPNFVGSGEKLFTTDSYPSIPIDPSVDWKVFTPSFYSYIMEKIPVSIQKYSYGSQQGTVNKLYSSLKNAGTYERAKTIFMEKANTIEYTIIDNLFWSYLYESIIDVHDKRQMEYLRAIYDQQLVQIDSTAIADFIGNLESSKFKDTTIVLITSEHGQEFGEHGIFDHTTLYNGNIRVPFILAVPGVRPHKFTNPVQGIDIVPTLLELVGIDTPAYPIFGKSLVPLLTGSILADRVIVTELDGGDSRAFQKGEWKVLAKKIDNKTIPYEVYNTRTDPDEKNNLLVPKIDMAVTIVKEGMTQYSLE